MWQQHLESVCCSKGTTVTGYEGQHVTIECTHSRTSTNAKYFCGGRCTGDHDVLIKTENGQTYQEKGRFSLRDTGTGTFYVTISDLKKTDTGTYWCGASRFGLDAYTEVYLTVVNAPHPAKHPTSSTTLWPTVAPPDTTAPNQGREQTAGTCFSLSLVLIQHNFSLFLLSHVGLVTMVMVLALAVCLFLKVQHRSRKSQGSVMLLSLLQVTQTIYEYVEIKKMNQQPGGVYEDLSDTVDYSFVELLTSQECPTYSNIAHPKKLGNTSPNATTIPNSVVYSSVMVHRDPPDSAIYSITT
ncbi:CMRF35-like molecule 8 [Arapaima gigas]